MFVERDHSEIGRVHRIVERLDARPPDIFREAIRRGNDDDVMELLSDEISSLMGAIDEAIDWFATRQVTKKKSSTSQHRKCRMIDGDDDEVGRQSGSSHDGDMPDDLTRAEVTCPTTSSASLPCRKAVDINLRSGSVDPDRRLVSTAFRQGRDAELIVGPVTSARVRSSGISPS